MKATRASCNAVLVPPRIVRIPVVAIGNAIAIAVAVIAVGHAVAVAITVGGAIVVRLLISYAAG